MKFRGKLTKGLQGRVFQCKDVKRQSGKGSKNPEVKNRLSQQLSDPGQNYKPSRSFRFIIFPIRRIFPTDL